MRIFLVLLIFSFLAVGCASQPLTEKEKQVRVFTRSDPPGNCKEVGKIKTSKYMSITPEGREEDIKREAAKLDGNAAQPFFEDANMIKATVFKCP